MSSEISAAERAEARRQKILAKKNARMSYAAGDYSKLPSAAPTEATQPTEKLVLASNSSPQPMQRSETPARFEQVRHTTRDLGAPLQAVLKSSLFRALLLGITAIVFAFTMHRGIVEIWRISAVEVFVCAEMCLLLPRVISAQGLFKRGSGGSAMSPLRMLSCAQELYAAINGVIGDFCAYMVCFLYTWYVLVK